MVKRILTMIIIIIIIRIIIIIIIIPEGGGRALRRLRDQHGCEEGVIYASSTTLYTI